MKARLVSFTAVVLALLFAASAAHATMQDDVDRALSILQRFEEIPETAIPPAVMRDAKGVAIFTITKAGFVVSGRGGTGVVLARTENGWSAPSAIGTGGIGVGFQAGVQVSEYVIILNTPEAVKAFTQGSNFTLGANLSAAVGPVGRSAEAAVTPMLRSIPTVAVKESSLGFRWRVRCLRPAMKPTRLTTKSRFTRPIFLRAK